LNHQNEVDFASPYPLSLRSQLQDGRKVPEHLSCVGYRLEWTSQYLLLEVLAVTPTEL